MPELLCQQCQRQGLAGRRHADVFPPVQVEACPSVQQEGDGMGGFTGFGKGLIFPWQGFVGIGQQNRRFRIGGETDGGILQCPQQGFVSGGQG